MDAKEAGEVFVNPSAFADDARFHAACALLRREDPIHLVEHPDYPPFHVLTKHADVLDVELHPAAWTNGPLPVLATKEAVALQEAQGVQLLRTLIHLDGEEHKAYRNITVDWFTPKALVGLEPRLAQLAKHSVDRMVELGGSCDFARDIAQPLPLQVILSILGLPEGDYGRMLKLTQELFGASDAEVGRGDTPEDVGAVIADFFAYFTDLVNDRQANPTDDLASIIANATVDLGPLWFKNVDVVGSFGYAMHDLRGERMHTFDLALSLLASGAFPSDLVVTHTFPLDDVRAALSVANARDQGAIKVQLLP